MAIGVVRISEGSLILYKNPPEHYMGEGILENVKVLVEEGVVTITGDKRSYTYVMWRARYSGDCIGESPEHLSDEDMVEYDLDWSPKKSYKSWEEYQKECDALSTGLFKHLWRYVRYTFWGKPYPKKDYSQYKGWAVQGWMCLKERTPVRYEVDPAKYILVEGITPLKA